MRWIPLLLATIGLLALAGLEPAPAVERPDVVLRLEAERTSVALGERFVLTVTLERKRGRPVEIHALRLSRDSVSLRVEEGGRTHTVTRVHGEIAGSADRSREVVTTAPPKTTLVRGKPLSIEIPVHALLPGRQTWRAVFAGWPESPEPLVSEPVEIEITAPSEGARIGAVLDTTEGTIVLSLWPEQAFNTVTHFLEFAHQEFYTGLTFHRISPGFLVQGGDPKGDGTGGPGYFLPDEVSAEVKHERGVISLARAPSVPDSGGCQFFLLLAAAPRLDGKYTAFGRVEEGLDVLDRLAALPVVATADGEVSRPVEPPVIRGVKKR